MMIQEQESQLGALLTLFDAIVSVADSAQDAMKALSAVRPHILISDLAMPGEDGYSFFKRVRKLSSRQLGRVPALALTAFASSDDATPSLNSGFQGHLAKPVDSVELARVISEILKIKLKSPKILSNS
jgi:CheY-like chemotaxis protein